MCDVTFTVMDCPGFMSYVNFYFFLMETKFLFSQI